MKPCWNGNINSINPPSAVGLDADFVRTFARRG